MEDAVSTGGTSCGQHHTWVHLPFLPVPGTPTLPTVSAFSLPPCMRAPPAPWLCSLLSTNPSDHTTGQRERSMEQNKAEAPPLTGRRSTNQNMLRWMGMTQKSGQPSQDQLALTVCSHYFSAVMVEHLKTGCCLGGSA